MTKAIEKVEANDNKKEAKEQQQKTNTELEAENKALKLALSVSQSREKLSKEDRENLESECFVHSDRSIYKFVNVNATAKVFEIYYSNEIKTFAKDVLKTEDEKLTLSELKQFIATLF